MVRRKVPCSLSQGPRQALFVLVLFQVVRRLGHPDHVQVFWRGIVHRLYRTGQNVYNALLEPDYLTGGHNGSRPSGHMGPPAAHGVHLADKP